jgi:multidrug efflux pump
MLSATFLAIFYIPLFFVLVRRGVRDGIAKLRGRPTGFRGNDDDGSDGNHREGPPYGPNRPLGPPRPREA